MAQSTIECYSLWVKQFLRFSATAHRKWVHPSELGTADVEAFLNDMVVTRQLAGSTQYQALNALVFLYKHVLDAIPSDHLGKFFLQRSKRATDKNAAVFHSVMNSSVLIGLHRGQ